MEQPTHTDALIALKTDLLQRTLTDIASQKGLDKLGIEDIWTSLVTDRSVLDISVSEIPQIVDDYIDR